MEPRAYSTLALYRRLFALSGAYRLHIVGVLLLSLLSTPIALLAPLPLKIVVDSVIGSQPLPEWLARVGLAGLLGSQSGALAVAVILLIGVALLNQLQVMSNWVLQTYTGEQLLLQFRALLFAHVQRLSFTYHDTRGSADSTYRIQYDAQSVQHLAVNGFVPFVTSILTLTAMLVVTARFDWTLAVIAAAVVPPLFVIAQLARARLRAQWEDVRRHESSAMSIVHEVLGSLRVVKAFGQEEREQQRFVEQSSRTTGGQIKLAWTQSFFDLLVGITIAAGMAAALFFGARHVRSGALSLGGMVMVMAYMAQLLAPVESITRRFAQLQCSFAGAARALALLDEKPDVTERPRARRLVRASGALSARHLSFGYNSDVTVLRDINFEIAPGTRVGIAGQTGAGKTTLVNLLTRFYDPVEGQILLDGVDLRDYKLRDLRRQFAIVLQEPVLFSASLAENIAYARPDASVGEIVAAAQAASAHDFINALPDGYDTQVGERGLRLSGGERQRISLARAFLKDAPILILDEPTSSVDLRTEAAIMQATHRLMEGRTTFIIAHRLSTLERCDVRLVLDHGRIVDTEPAHLASS
jgi:ATP-binding cassette, subfamily B, bacterial